MSTAYYRIDGRRLAEARLAAFLTQLQLSEASGISLATIQGIEQPRRSRRYTAGQRPYTVIALANAMGITPQALLCITSPQGKTVGKPPDTAVGTEHVSHTSEPRHEHVTPARKAFDLGVDLEPRTLIAEGEDLSPQAAFGRPEKFHLADVCNLHLIVSLKDRYRRRPAWNGVTEGLLTGLILGGKKNPAYGARAVNAAIEELYENAAGVSNPAGYLRERAEAHSQSDSKVRT